MGSVLAEQWPLVLMWLLYGGLHSQLARADLKTALCIRYPALAPRYRLVYNAIAGLTLLPIAAWQSQHPGPLLWAWEGAAAWIANGCAVLALIGWRSTSRHYDLAGFLGLRPPLAGKGLRLSPLHRHVRHPWYSLGLVLIWSRDMNAAMLVSALCITLYLVLGSRREENDLLREFGDAYRIYRQRVPGLLPLPGKSLSAADAERLSAASADLGPAPTGLVRKR